MNNIEHFLEEPTYISSSVKISYFLNKIKLLKYNVLYININSINNKLHLLEDIIEDLGEIHIIALTEIRIFSEQNKYFNLNNYNAYFNNRSDGEGGVALYIHKSITSILSESVCEFNVHRLIIKLPELSINVAVLYKQPSANHEFLINCINSILGDRRRVILLGDMNADLLSKDCRVEEYANTVLGHGYSILNEIKVDSATRVGLRNYARHGTRVSKTIIDHAITDLYNFKFNLSLNNCPISDHKMILLSFNDNSNRKINFTTQTSDISHKFIDNCTFQRNFEETDWANFHTFDEFLSKLTSIRNSSIKTLNSQSKLNPFKAWINEDLIKLVSERNRYFKLLKKSPSNEYLKRMHEKLNDSTKALRVQLRRQSNESNIKKNLNNPKKLWQTINEILTNRTKSNPPIKAINTNSATITDQFDIANSFNSYFRDVGKTLFDKIPIAPQPIPNTIERSRNSVFLQPTSPDEIINVIFSLKQNNSVSNCIPTKMLRLLANSIAPKLSELINECFSSGVFPSKLKVSRIVPLFKAADPMAMDNYRPISIIENISKIIEILICDRLLSFCNRFNIININQYGFQKKSCTGCAVTEIIEYLKNNIDKQKNSVGACLFIDLKKAFDTISHELLLQKLDSLGIRGQLNNLLKSYLENRTQYVDIDGTFSNRLINNNPFATPQGSNLGPLLFLLYINDIFELPLHGKMVLFADDTSVSYIDNNITSLKEKMQSDIDILNSWFSKNKLTMNILKTKILPILMESSSITNLKLTIENQTIECVDKINYLGIVIQSNLKWDSHINGIIRRIYSVAGVIRRLGNRINESVLTSVYYALIFSHIFYLAPVYGTSSTQSELNRLQIAQNCAIRSIYSYDYHTLNLSTVEIYDKYNILNINQIIDYSVGLWMYKREHNLMKLNLNTARHNELHTYNTRFANNLIPNRARTNLGFNSTLNYGARLYNSLDNAKKNQHSLGIFKSYLKNHVKRTI